MISLRAVRCSEFVARRNDAFGKRKSGDGFTSPVRSDFRELEILTRSLLFIHHHSSGRLSQFQLGAHLLNLRGLVFYCCRETRNRGFQFRDPLLLLLKFIECRLVLGALGSAYSHLLPTGIDKARAQVTIGIDVHGEGGAVLTDAP